VVTCQLQVERRTGKVPRSKTDVPPLNHATNQRGKTIAADIVSAKIGKLISETGANQLSNLNHKDIKQEAQLSLTIRAMLVCIVVEVWQDFLSEYVDKKFSYIYYRRLIRHE